MTTFLRDLVSVADFSRYLADGYISERPHELDSSLRVYSYTPKAQFGGFWTPEMRLARGLMLRVTESLEDAVVVGRGLPKFFTIEQVDSDWGRPKLVDDDENVVIQEAVELPWEAPAFVADKLNGALGLAYMAPNGLAVSTKGSFGSLEAKIATRLMRSKLSKAAQERFLELTDGETALFEIITPERPHPVDYGELEDIILLGRVSHKDGKWHPAAADDKLVKEFGFSVAQRLELLTLRDAVEAPYRENSEGLVVTIEDNGVQHLYKVKPAEYLALRKAFYALETVDFIDLVTATPEAELEELTAEAVSLPVGLRNAEALRKRIREQLLEPLAERVTAVREEYKLVRGTGELPGRPEFAAKVKGYKGELPPALLFKAYDEELSGTKQLAGPVLRMLVKEIKKAAAEA